MLRRSILLGWCALLLAACAPTPPAAFKATDITGASFGRALALDDVRGTRRTLAEFKGRAVVLFFGYTHCPDVCPTALARFADAVRRLGDAGPRVQVLFVTVDPERDTPAKLAAYAPFFHPDFIALTGTPAEIAAVAKEFRVYYSRQPGASDDGYAVDHWAGAYAFDPAGRLRLYLPPELPAEHIAADLQRLLRGD